MCLERGDVSRHRAVHVSLPACTRPPPWAAPAGVLVLLAAPLLNWRWGHAGRGTGSGTDRCVRACVCVCVCEGVRGPLLYCIRTYLEGVLPVLYVSGRMRCGWLQARETIDRCETPYSPDSFPLWAVRRDSVGEMEGCSTSVISPMVFLSLSGIEIDLDRTIGVAMDNMA